MWRLRRLIRRKYLAGRSSLIKQVILGRVVVDRETAKMVSKLPVNSIDALEISGKRWSEFGFKSFLSVDYPEYDICSGPLIVDSKALSFAIIITEQVSEHLVMATSCSKKCLQHA